MSVNVWMSAQTSSSDWQRQSAWLLGTRERAKFSDIVTWARSTEAKTATAVLSCREQRPDFGRACSSGVECHLDEEEWGHPVLGTMQRGDTGS